MYIYKVCISVYMCMFVRVCNVCVCVYLFMIIVYAMSSQG